MWGETFSLEKREKRRGNGRTCEAKRSARRPAEGERNHVLIAIMLAKKERTGHEEKGGGKEKKKCEDHGNLTTSKALFS